MCTLDVLAVEAVETGAVDGDFVVATDARRKEVYLASYDADGARIAGPAVARPADVATDLPVVGPGRAAATPRRSRGAVGPQRPSAGWLARVVAEERAELLDPEPLYLRRPDAVGARRPQAGLVRVTARRAPRDADGVAALEAATLGDDAWSPGLVAEGVPRRAADHHLPARRARDGDRPSGTRWPAWPATSWSCSASACSPSTAATGVASALLDAVDDLARGAGAERVLLEVREDNARRPGLLRRARVRRDRPPAALLPRRRDGVVLERRTVDR